MVLAAGWVLALGACGEPIQEAGDPALAAATAAAVSGPLTGHFSAWLSAHGYGGYGFERADLAGGSFGGKRSADDRVVNEPVIFIHGNSDRALGGAAGGFSASVAYFQGQGYRTSELYATTWGPADPLQASAQYHSRTNLTRVRAFIQAVREYTGAARVDVVAHSMGVTLARKAILGGPARDLAAGGDYDLGARLDFVDTFVGIAGSNAGLVACYASGPSTPTCGSTNGFYPGYMVGLLGPYGVSAFLQDLGQRSHFEGAHVYSMWSSVDELIGYGDLVWGRYTSRIPGQDGERRYDAVPYGHFGLKSQTAAAQLRMVRDHRVD